MYPKTTYYNESPALYKPGDLVQASYTFNEGNYEDLPFSQNDTLEIIRVVKDSNWAHARSATGEIGLIPLNYVHSVTATTHSWYHGRISRKESELIMHGYPVGSFLVRDSDLYPGDLTLCLVGPPMPQSTKDVSTVDHRLDGTDRTSPPRTHSPPTNVQHYHINCEKILDEQSGSELSNPLVVRCSLDEYDWFSNLPDLIKFYSLPNNGLVAPLLHPIVDLLQIRLNQLRNDGWIIPRGELLLGASIGRGEFGEVHEAMRNDQKVAVKIYKTACKLAITYEASLLTKVNHKNVVAFVGLVYEPDDCIYLVTEYLVRGSLLAYLHSRTRSEVSQQMKLQFSVDICLGMEHLERCRIIHRDLAARNVLLSDQPSRLTAKVADFGLARRLDEPSLTGSPVRQTSASAIDDDCEGAQRGRSTSRSVEYIVLHDSAAIPVKWTAPEAVRKRFFSIKSDVWSFGVLMWEIYSHGRIPYPRLMVNKVIRQLESGYRMKSPDECPSDVYSLMNRTWQLDPCDRPGFSDILIELTLLLTTVNANDKLSTPPTTVYQISLPSQPDSDRNNRRTYWRQRNHTRYSEWLD